MPKLIPWVQKCVDLMCMLAAIAAMPVWTQAGHIEDGSPLSQETAQAEEPYSVYEREIDLLGSFWGRMDFEERSHAYHELRQEESNAEDFMRFREAYLSALNKNASVAFFDGLTTLEEFVSTHEIRMPALEGNVSAVVVNEADHTLNLMTAKGVQVYQVGRSFEEVNTWFDFVEAIPALNLYVLNEMHTGSGFTLGMQV